MSKDWRDKDVPTWVKPRLTAALQALRKDNPDLAREIVSELLMDLDSHGKGKLVATRLSHVPDPPRSIR